MKRIGNVSAAIEFLKTLESLNRWSRKYVVLDCPAVMAKEIIISHVRDITLGRRTYHYLLSDLVSVECGQRKVKKTAEMTYYIFPFSRALPPRPLLARR